MHVIARKLFTIDHPTYSVMEYGNTLSSYSIAMEVYFILFVHIIILRVCIQRLIHCQELPYTGI